MKKSHFTTIVFVFLLQTLILAQQGTDMQFLNSGWSFAYQDTNYSATVPGNIFFDLFINNIIPNPYFGDNEQNIQWVSGRKWQYILNFEVDSSFFQYKNISIVFEGLDTYADVYLNEKHILTTDNMFRIWKIPVADLLRSNNNLKVVFSPPLKIDSIKTKSQSYKFPDPRAFTRKAPYQYGWDWGPKLVGVGIWKDVYLKVDNGFVLNDVFINQKSIDSNLAKLTAVFDIESFEDDSIEIEIYNNTTNETHVLKVVAIEQSSNLIHFDFEIPNPKLWWPNGMGEPYMYELFVDLTSKTKSISRELKIGLRTIRLVQKPDKYGTGFYFEVNGKPVFVKGANYIPQENFPSLVGFGRYEKIIKDAVISNMNMLRVWGGGIYEKDLFYDLCDKYGILVWQDFMFACNFYPGDDKYFDNVKNEAEEQIRRLRNHPSIALWCGNNEVDEAWHNWGYQESLNYSEQDSMEIWENYKKLFHKLLPELVNELSPSSSYISTSPKIGWGHKEALLSGDMHYWGVWWGEDPFEIYKKKIGRFMSEYGFQGFPDVKTIGSFVDSDNFRLDSPALLNHQKHPRGMQLIRNYMERDFPVPDEFEDYLYISQLVQSYGINMAIEAHRRAKPYCMGTLYWQYNDSWPVISWSGIDYYGRWKAMQYNVKKSFQTVIISDVIREDSLDIFIVSDSINELSGKLVNTLMRFDGEIVLRDTIDVELGANENKKIVSYSFEGYLESIPASEAVLYSTLQNGQRTISGKMIYFTKPKDLNLSKPNIKYTMEKNDNEFVISLVAGTLVKNLYLNTESEGHFSDNYFDLLPDEKYKVVFIPKDNSVKELDLKFNYLNKF